MASTNKEKLKELLGKIAVSPNTITVEDDINHYTILELLNALRSNITEIEKKLDILNGQVREEIQRLVQDGSLGELINEELLGDINLRIVNLEAGTVYYQIVSTPGVQIHPGSRPLIVITEEGAYGLTHPSQSVNRIIEIYSLTDDGTVKINSDVIHSKYGPTSQIQLKRMSIMRLWSDGTYWYVLTPEALN